MSAPPPKRSRDQSREMVGGPASPNCAYAQPMRRRVFQRVQAEDRLPLSRRVPLLAAASSPGNRQPHVDNCADLLFPLSDSTLWLSSVEEDMLALDARVVGVRDLQPRGASVLNRVDSLPAIARPGDHIAVLGPNAPVWHHGILADSSHVFDLYGACKQSAVVSRRSIPDFMHGVTAAAIVHYPDDDAGFRLLTLCLAEAYSTSKLNRKGQYDAIRRNCESFATWCRSTRWASHQSQVMQECAMARSVGVWITILHMLNALAVSA